MPSWPFSESSARPTAIALPVILTTSPARAPIRCRSIGASLATARPISSTRASATRSLSAAAQADGVISVMGSLALRCGRRRASTNGSGPFCARSASRGPIAMPAVSFARSVKQIIPRLVGRQPTDYSAEPPVRRQIPVPHDWRIANRQPTEEILRRSKLVKYDLFHVFNVPPHCSLCGFGVLALDGSQNSPVARERFLRSTFHLHRPFPRFAQQIHENVEHLQHNTVSRSQSDAVVKFRIFGNGRFSTRQSFLLPLENVCHFRDFVRRSVGSRPRSQRGLQHFAEIKQLAHHRLFALQGIGKRIDQRVGRYFANDGASALPRFDQTNQFQAPNSVSNRTSAYLQHLSQLAFRWELVTRLQFFQNQAFDLSCHFLVDFVLSNKLEVGFGEGWQAYAPSGPISGPANQKSIQLLSSVSQIFLLQ